MDELEFDDIFEDKDTFLVKLPHKLKQKLIQNKTFFELNKDVGTIYRK